jgi:hypothetical protein
VTAEIDIGVETGVAELCGVRFSTQTAELLAGGWTMGDHDLPLTFWNQAAELTRPSVAWLGQVWDIRILTPAPFQVDLYPPEAFATEAQLVALLGPRFGPAHELRPLPRWTLPSGARVSIEDEHVVFSLPLVTS